LGFFGDRSDDALLESRVGLCPHGGGIEQRAHLIELGALPRGERLDSVAREVGNPVIFARRHLRSPVLLVR
jgi:hypothetical protein